MLQRYVATRQESIYWQLEYIAVECRGRQRKGISLLLAVLLCCKGKKIVGNLSNRSEVWQRSLVESLCRESRSALLQKQKGIPLLQTRVLCCRGMWLAVGNPSLGSWSALLQRHNKEQVEIPLLAKVNNSRESHFQSNVVQRLSS